MNEDNKKNENVLTETKNENEENKVVDINEVEEDNKNLNEKNENIKEEKITDINSIDVDEINKKEEEEKADKTNEILNEIKEEESKDKKRDELKDKLDHEEITNINNLDDINEKKEDKESIKADFDINRITINENEKEENKEKNININNEQDIGNQNKEDDGLLNEIEKEEKPINENDNKNIEIKENKNEEEQKGENNIIENKPQEFKECIIIDESKDENKEKEKEKEKETNLVLENKKEDNNKDDKEKKELINEENQEEKNIEKSLKTSEEKKDEVKKEVNKEDKAEEIKIEAQKEENKIEEKKEEDNKGEILLEKKEEKIEVIKKAENKEENKIEENKKDIKKEEDKKEETIENKKEENIININNDKTDENINIINEDKNNIENNSNKISEQSLFDKYLDSKYIEKISELTKTNYNKFYMEKYFCDYNSGSEWRSGFIVKIENNEAEIIDATNKSIKGEKFHKKKINMKDGTNISYFRKYSKPDVFMSKGSSKNLKNKLAQFTNFHKEFENYYQNCDNYEFYYFLRATVYYGLDFCMNININPNKNQDDIVVSFKMILIILDIIVDCLKFIEKNLSEFTDYQNNIKNGELNDLVLINKKFAIFSFYDDIHFLIKKIFGDSAQYLDWYIEFKDQINLFNPALNKKVKEIENIPLYKDQEGTNNLMERICAKEIYNNKDHIFTTLDKEISSCIIGYFTDYFNFKEGYKTLFKILYSIEHKNGENINDKFKIQYSLIEDLYSAKAITDTFYNSQKEEIRNTKSYINKYIDNLEENSIEKINKKEISQFFNRIFDLIEQSKEQKEILNENVTINYIFKKTKFSRGLEKKISFLTELNKIIKSVEYNELKKNPEKNEKELNNPKYNDRNKEIQKMTSEHFCQICHEKEVIKSFLDTNTHEEIIKRIYPLLKIMYLNNYGYSKTDREFNKETITNELFKILIIKLEESEKNNESLWKIIQGIFLDFSEILSRKDNYSLFVLIKEYINRTINKKSYKLNQLFSFIINYSLKCIEKNKNDKSKKGPKKDNKNEVNNNGEKNENKIESYFDENQYYCLEMLINVLLEKDKIKEDNFDFKQKKEIFNTCIDGIIEILNKTSNNENIIKIIISKIISTITNSVNIVPNVILFGKIIKINSNKIKNEIKDFCEKNNSITSIIKEFEEYLNKILSENNFEKKDNNDEKLLEIQDNIEKRLELIFMILNKENDIKFNPNEISNLFNTLISSNPFVKQIYNSTLKKNVLNINFDLRSHIFNNLLFKRDSNNEYNDLANYQLIKQFILEINKSSNIFMFITEKDMIVNTSKFCDDIQGYNELWELLLKTENKQIQNDITDFLRDIYLGVKYPEIEKYVEFWNKIIDKIIKEMDKENNSIKVLIELIKKIIDESENDGEIIKDNNIVQKVLENMKTTKKDIIDDNGESLMETNEQKPTKICFRYEEEKENLNSKKKKSKKNIINSEFEINQNTFFYHLKYYLSYRFQIPLKCVDISEEISKSSKDKKNKENDDLTLFNDFVNIYIKFPELFDNQLKKGKKEIIPVFIVKKIKNPLNDENRQNIKKVIDTHSSLQEKLMKLLKNKNGDYTQEIWNMIKGKKTFFNTKIFGFFNDLNNIENKNQLEEVFNLENSSMFYINYILYNLYLFFSNKEKPKKNEINNFIKSNIWKNKIKNLSINSNNNNEINANKYSSINEIKEEKKYILNLVNIYGLVINNINDEGNEDIKFITEKIYIILNDFVKECSCIELNSFKIQTEEDKNYIIAIKKYYLDIINGINNMLNNKNIFNNFIEFLINGENKYKEIFEYCFFEGIFCNKYPFLNEKVSQLLIHLIESNFYKENANLQKELYKYIAQFFFTKEKNEMIIQKFKELFNNNDGNESNKKNNDDISIIIDNYNLKLYYKTISKILYDIYNITCDGFDYDNYIIESIIPYIYDPIFKDIKIKKGYNFHDSFFGTQCQILYNYIQVMHNIDEEKFNKIFNYNGKNLKEYLFDEIIMYKCDGDSKVTSPNKKINDSLKEAGYLFIAIVFKEIYSDNLSGHDLSYYLEIMNKFNTLGYWRGNDLPDWKLNYREESTFSTSFVGLKNLGCTCYMNSLLQVFYHIIPFRESLLKCACKDEKKNSLCEVKKLFYSLKYIKDSYYTPNSFVNNYDNEKLNIHQQMDVDEFFSNILDKLENRIKNTENENLIKYFFQGRLNDNLTFQEGCTHHRTNVNDFYSIQLQVQNKKNIYESLDTFIEGELMNGDNCIFCPKCNKKFPALKSQCFRTLPRMLVFVLKRFEFNYDTMQKIKINDYYEFPLELDLNKYTQDYIDSKDNKDNNDNKDSNDKANKQDNKYNLKSIVIHQGYSEGGHYYAFIKDNLSQEWYQFNDTRVNKFNLDELGAEAFGGKDPESKIEKNRNAYLLFYEKIDDSNCESFNNINAINSLNKQDNENADDNNDFNLLKDDNDNDNKNKINTGDDEDKIKNEVLKNVEQESNISYLNKKLFSNEYHHFALEIYINFINSIDKGKNGLLSSFDEFCNIEIENPDFRNEAYHFRKHKIKVSNLGKYIREDKIKIFNFYEKNKNINPEEIQIKIIEIFESILINFFNVIIRSKEKKYFSCYVDLIKYLINSYDYCANYFLEEFSCYNVIIEYLINCPLYEIKKVIVELINYAMNKSVKSYKYEEKKEIHDSKEDILKNNPKYNEIFENEKKINNNQEVKESSSGFMDDVVIINDSEIKPTSNSEIQNINNDKKKGKKNIFKTTLENTGKNKINNAEKNPNNEVEDKITICPNVINFINSIFAAMRKIKFANKNELRFLFYVLLKFSLLSDKERNYLNKQYRLNLLTYFHISNKQDVDQLRMFDDNIAPAKKMEHEILNSNPHQTILGEKDKVGVYKLLNYDFMFLCNSLYYKEKLWEEIGKKHDRFFSFYDDIDDEEKDVTKSNILLFLKKAQTKQDINYLSNLFKKKCYDDKTFFDNLLSKLLEILELISDNENSFFDKFDEENYNEIYKDSKNDYLLRRLRSNVDIIIIKILFDVKDNKFDDYRIKNVINGLNSLFKKYKKYYSISISFINILIDIFSQQNDLLQKYKKNLNDILDWLQKNKIPPKLYDIKGIKMYKPSNQQEQYEMMMYSQYSHAEIDKKVREDFDKVETEKTNKKIDFINSIINNEITEKDISNCNCDFSDFKFAIGDEVIYDKKNYVITECLDELIKIKLIESNEESEFKAKGYHEKKLSPAEKEKKCFWIDTNNYKLRIRRLYTPNFKKEVNQIVNSFYQEGNEIKI